MNLLIIRHAIAEEWDAYDRLSKSDGRRALTAEGRAKMIRGAKGLHRLVRALDFIVCSPLVRAQQTAEIVATEYGMEIGDITEALEPDARLDHFTKWAERYASKEMVAVVGHEPHLSTLVTWLLAGIDESRIAFKKGGACLLTCDGIPEAGNAVLQWMMTPAALRELA